jgi:hypothetical protein
MAATKTATARMLRSAGSTHDGSGGPKPPARAERVGSRSPRGAAPTAIESVLEERFVSEGRAMVWREGSSLVPSRYREEGEAQRAEREAVFLRKLVPQAERRGIVADKRPAAPAEGVAVEDARWVCWFREGEDPAPLWALFAHSRALAGAPADNDTWRLVAWGDGPALAWASDEPAAQRCLRAALRVPPPWLAGGMASRDPSFPVRIERATERSEAGQAVGARAPEGEPAKGARAVLAAWRKAHPARSA